MTSSLTPDRLDWLISAKGGLTSAIRRFDRQLEADCWGPEIRLEGYERGISPRQVAIERRNALVNRLSDVNAELKEPHSHDD